MPRSRLGVFSLATITILSFGCQSYQVDPKDHTDFKVVLGSVDHWVERIAGSMEASDHDPVVMGYITQIRDSEDQISAHLAKKDLKFEEVKNLKGSIESIRTGYTDLVGHVSKDPGTYGFLEQEASQDKLRQSVEIVGVRTWNIEERLVTYIEEEEEAFKRRVRTSTAAVGAAVVALDQSITAEFDEKIKNSQDSPDKVRKLEKRKRKIEKAIHSWLKVVDAQLSGIVSTESWQADFLKPDELAEAIKNSLTKDERKQFGLVVDLTVILAIGSLERLISKASKFNQDILAILGDVSAEISQIRREYEDLHPL